MSMRERMPEGKIDPSLESSLPVNGTGNPSELSAVRRMREVFDRPQTRRNFLRMLGGAGAFAMGVRPDGTFASQTDQQESHATPVVSEDHTDVSPQGPDQSHQTPDSTHESEHHTVTKANLISAGIVVGNFFRQVGMILSERSHGFNGETFRQNTAAAIARDVWLSKAGDHVALEHDIKEFKGSYPLVPVLVGLAEAADKFKVSNNEIYKSHTRMNALIQEIGIGDGETRLRVSESSRKVNGFMQLELENRDGSAIEDQESNIYESNHQSHEVESEAPKHIDFDDLDVSKDVEDWEGYLQHIQQEVIDSLAQNAATTAVFAPFTTTYSSSAIASENQENIYRKIARLRYVRDVIDVKRLQVSRKASQYIDRNQVEKLQEDAQERALNIINGFGGYNHLSLTLSSNANGMALIGDPPMLFYLSRHGLGEFAELSAKGMLVSEASELVHTYAFLKIAGGVDVNAVQFIGSYLANQGRTLRKIGQSLTNGALADVSFNGGRNTAKSVTKILESLNHDGISDDVRNELISKMHETPEPSIFIDPRTLIKQKLESIGKWERLDSIRHTDNDLVSEYMRLFASGEFEDFVSYYASEEYSQLVADDKREQIKAGLKAMQKLGATKESSKLTALLESLALQTHPDTDDDLLSNDNGNQTVPSIDTVLKALTSIDARTEGKPKLRNIFSDLMSITPEEFQQYEKMQNEDDQVSNLDPEKIDKIKGIYESFNVLDKGDVRASLEDALLLAEEEEYVHKEDDFLSESAHEVAFALLSQLPVVPSFSVLAKEGLQKAFGSDGGEVSRADVVNQVDALLASGAVFSATADNVAAYLYVETVMEEVMTEFYGEEVYRSNHELQEVVWTSSAIIAMTAGANSKYGNGPNLLQYNMDRNFDRHAIPLKTTLGNPYAILQTLATGFALRALIHKNMPEKPTA